MYLMALDTQILDINALIENWVLLHCSVVP